MKRRTFYIYILASKSRTLYTGITSKFYSRIYEHKNDLLKGFSSKYKIHRLVYYECFDDVRKAISREKQIKAWTRAKRVALISSVNPTWEDLAEKWYESHPYQPEIATASFQKQIPRYARDDNSKEVSRAEAAAASKVAQKQIPRSARDDNSQEPLANRKLIARNHA